MRMEMYVYYKTLQEAVDAVADYQKRICECKPTNSDQHSQLYLTDTIDNKWKKSQYSVNCSRCYHYKKDRR